MGGEVGGGGGGGGFSLFDSGCDLYFLFLFEMTEGRSRNPEKGRVLQVGLRTSNVSSELNLGIRRSVLQ